MVIWFYVLLGISWLPFPALLLLFSVNRNFVLSTHVIWLTNKTDWFTRKFHSLHYITWRSRTEAAAAIKFVNVEPLFLNEPKQENPNGDENRQSRHCFWREKVVILVGREEKKSPVCRGFALVLRNSSTNKRSLWKSRRSPRLSWICQRFWKEKQPEFWRPKKILWIAKEFAKKSTRSSNCLRD